MKEITENQLHDFLTVEITENQLHDFLTVDTIARKIVSLKSCNFPEIFFGGHEFFFTDWTKVVQIIKCTCTVFIDNFRNISTNSSISSVYRESYDGYVKLKRNDPMCVVWDSQVNEKTQFLILFLLLFALTF